MDRATLQTQLTLACVDAYALDTSIIHNDSTTIKFYGAYKAQSRNAAQLKRGHSKDHRPDLKQLVYNLSITEDGAVPVHFKCHDGNKTDDTLHIETWLTLRGLLQRSDFLYVADAKLCTAENMGKIDKDGGRFVTIVPDTRAETQRFAELCYQSQVRWQALTRRESTRRKGKYDVFQIAEGFYQLDEGFRLFWYRSSEKRQRDEQSRRERIEAALEKLDQLQRERRRGPKTARALLNAATKVVQRYQVAPWLNLETRTREEEQWVQLSYFSQPSDPGSPREGDDIIG
jgi:transposase